MAHGPGSTKARAQSIYALAMLANARRTAASDAAAVTAKVDGALIGADLTDINPILKDKLDTINARIDALEPPE